MNIQPAPIFSFGPFCLDLCERTLTYNGKAVAIAPKLFETLAILVSCSGQIVTKQRMMEQLWPDTFVEESSLSQNIFQLRKILRTGKADVTYIDTIPKRGYRFVRVTGASFGGSEIRTTESKNVEARQAYLLGTYFSKKRTKEALARSIDYFHEVVVLDPEFGSAHAGLADSYFWLAYGEIDPVFRRESFELSRTHALRSIELDPSSAAGYAALGTVQIKNDHDAAAADISFRSAITADQNCGMAYTRYAYFLAAMGRLNEAMTMIRRAYEIDPLSPDANASLAMIHYFQRDYDATVRCCRTALALEPSLTEAMLLLGRAYQEKGSYKEAAAQFKKAKAAGSSEGEELLACLYALVGRTIDTQHLGPLTSQSDDESVRPFNIAAIYAALGEEDEAVRWLELPFINWTERLRMIRFDPRLDLLRTHPRFAEIIRIAMSSGREKGKPMAPATISSHQRISIGQ